MTLIERLENRVQELDSNIVLKSDYTDELETLDSMQSDLDVIHFYGANHQRVADLRKEINRIRAWILEETKPT